MSSWLDPRRPRLDRALAAAGLDGAVALEFAFRPEFAASCREPDEAVNETPRLVGAVEAALYRHLKRLCGTDADAWRLALRLWEPFTGSRTEFERVVRTLL